MAGQFAPLPNVIDDEGHSDFLQIFPLKRIDNVDQDSIRVLTKAPS